MSKIIAKVFNSDREETLLETFLAGIGMMCIGFFAYIWLIVIGG